ncbi:MAG TPA: alpha/beta fold hydrolase [Dehalococcoidia bacterium]|nr:alpha/beta fold hydrolase [Dehalococcoidia bacterium]
MEQAEAVPSQLPPGIASRFAMVGDIRTHYLEGGQGEAVVLLHSAEFGGRSEFSWRYNLAALAERFHVYAVDMVGFGRTDKLFSFTDQWGLRVRHIQRFLETLCIPAAHFIGNSFSGGLIQRVATMRPCPWNILSIISVSGGGHSPDNEYRRILNNYNGNREEMRRILQVLFWDERWWAEEIVEERWRASIEPGAWEAVAAARFGRPGHEKPFRSETADVSLIECPVLIVGGDQDLLREPGCWEDLHRRIPNSELHIFSPARHMPHIEFAEEFNRLAIDFLRRHSWQAEEKRPSEAISSARRKR